MHISFLHSLPKPASNIWIMRILIVALVVLALVAGYYYTAYNNEIVKYKRLEDKYVRVREILGRDETQRLIDLSHDLEMGE